MPLIVKKYADNRILKEEFLLIKGLSEMENFAIMRPLLGEHQRDIFNIPIMNKVTEEMLDFVNLQPLNIQNLSQKHNNTNKLVLTFAYDYRLEKFWKKSQKYIPLLQSACAVATPDFSLNPLMDFPEYLHNVYKNRWLGCLWQDYGILTIPTIGWTTAEWDYLSFSGVEKGSVVIISTLGSKSDKKFFLRGYNEMLRRIEPPLIIVYGDMLPEMKGRFINFRYEDSFKQKDSFCFQDVLFDISPIFEVKE